MININQIKQLREETSVSISECKKALEEANGDPEKAKNILKDWGKEIAKKKSTREVKQGIIHSYIHPNKRIGVLVDFRCETDFVSRSEDFKNLAHELCLQIAAMDPENKESLLEQPWIKDEKKNMKDLINEQISKSGENIVLEKFIRYEI